MKTMPSFTLAHFLAHFLARVLARTSRLALALALAVVAMGLLSACTTTPRSAAAATGPLLSNPWNPARPICRDGHRSITMCIGGSPQANADDCTCVSHDELVRSRLMPFGDFE